MPITNQIFIFGDSITYGQWDDNGGWVNRLRQHVDSKNLPTPSDYWIIYNLGIPSDTSTELIKRIDNETQIRLAKYPNNHNCCFVFAIGTNDARWLIEEDCHAISIKDFQDNLKIIHSIATKYSNKIIFIGLATCDESQALKAANRHGWVERYEDEAMIKFDNTIEQFCQDNSIRYVNLYKAFTHQDHTTLLNDGLHPNNDGHELIFKLVHDALIKENTK